MTDELTNLFAAPKQGEKAPTSPGDDAYSSIFNQKAGPRATPRVPAVKSAPAAAPEPAPSTPSTDSLREAAAPRARKAPAARKKSEGTPVYVHRDTQLWMIQRKGILTAERKARVTYTDLFMEALEELGTEGVEALFAAPQTTAMGMPIAPRKRAVSGGVQINLALIASQEEWLDETAASFDVSRSVFVSEVLEAYRERHNA